MNLPLPLKKKKRTEREAPFARFQTINQLLHRSGDCLRCQFRPERHDGLCVSPPYPEHVSNRVPKLLTLHIADEWKNDARNPKAKSGGH